MNEKRIVKFNFFTLLLFTKLFGNYEYEVLEITPKIKEKMIEGNSYNDSCPIKLKDLRYLKLQYINFNNESKIGELIVNKDVVNDLVLIFKKLYEIRYPIYKMQLISNFNGDDFASIEANNSSAFNCRKIENTNRWSSHSSGRAIDINPIQNPFISKNEKIFHKNSEVFKNRVRVNSAIEQKAMMLKNDEIVKLFKNQKWIWGGDWISYKDYQHFHKGPL